MEYQNYYETLGLKRNASQAEIKKAFRKLAREHHPDAKPGDKDAERRFKLINEANAVLSDPDKRKKYDTLGANWAAYADAGPARGPAGGPMGGFGRTDPGAGRTNVRYEFRTAGGGEFSDFFRTFFGQEAEPTGGGRGRTATAGPSFEDILADMGLDNAATRRTAGGGTSAANGSGPAVGATAEAVAEIGLEEAYHGTVRRVEIDGKRLDVTIPRGADNGTRVKVSGQGPGGGDLVVVVRVRPHPIFTRKGADLERELPITLKEALLGGDVPVTTLKGRVLLKILPGTQNGRIFRLKGQGMPHLRGDGVGDMLVRVRVVLPRALDSEAEAAAQTFLELVDQPDPR